MKYIIFQDGNEINTIVADEAFCSKYCEQNGYTYELMSEPEPDPIPEPEVPPTDDTNVWDELDAAYQEGVDSI